jgi:hypothetical protein
MAAIVAGALIVALLQSPIGYALSCDICGHLCARVRIWVVP